MRVEKKINSPLIKLQSYRQVKVKLEGTDLEPRGILQVPQAIDRDETTSSGSSMRRPCDAFSSWRTRAAGTGRLNR
jgi:hypothetical protein